MARPGILSALTLVSALILGTAGGASAAPWSGDVDPGGAGVTNATAGDVPPVIHIEPRDPQSTVRERWTRITEISATTPVFAFYTATWCGVCQKVKPVLLELAAEEAKGRWTVVILYDEIVRKGWVPKPWQLTLPSLVKIKNGRYKGVHEGCNDNRDDLRKVVDKIITDWHAG